MLLGLKHFAALLAGALCLVLLAPCRATEQPAPSGRLPNTTLRLPDRTPITGYGLVEAFPGITFERPVALIAPPGETNRLFVVEQSGAIYVITNLSSLDKSLFLDLSSQVVLGGGEGGLLGLAFHPGYATNRQFFVFLTRYHSTAGAANRLHDVVCRFEVSAVDPDKALPDSEVTILAQADDSEQHNGGDLKFGPDGYLYVSIGERVHRDIAWADQTPVDRDLQGAILRIDVDGRPGSLPPNPHPASTHFYWIPADNPFVGVTAHHGLPLNPSQLRTELYAVGFRNPWRMAFDSLTGDLYAVDVGGNRQEEINLIVSGADYGWPYFEGSLPYGYSPPPVFNPRAPLHTYSHGWSGHTNGNSIVGGVVYRADSMPWLKGHYLFSDFFTGHISALERQEPVAAVRRLVGSTIGPSAFGVDPRDGEVLLANYFDGAIRRLVYRPLDEATNLPPSLAETGIFADLASLSPAPGIIPYTINVPFWSDHAAKSRWFCLPETNMSIGFDPTGAWSFPTGAVWIKHFELEMTNGQPASARRLETRVLVNATDGFYGLTYRWSDPATNAWLVPEEGADERLTIRDADGGVFREQVWHYPSRADCLNCHTKWSGRVLGFNTAQLNVSTITDTGTTNQLRAFGDAGYLVPKPPAADELPALARADDPSVPLEFRTRSYFQANCSACHVPGAHGWVSWDARITTPLSQAGIISNGGVIVPGSLQESRLYHRLFGFPALMPPVGTSVYNSNALDLVANWITNLPPAPWAHETIGNVVHPGGSTVSNGVYHIGGAGRSLQDESDEFHFLHRPFDAKAAQLIVRLVSQSVPSDRGLAGLMAREGTGASNRFILAGGRADGTTWLMKRTEAGIPAVSEAVGEAPLPRWWRLVRRGGTMHPFCSGDGTNWVEVDAAGWEVRDKVRIGLAVNSASSMAFNNAVFDSVSYMSVILSNASPASIRQPAHVSLTASVDCWGRGLARVEFYDGTEKVGESTAAPHGIALSNLWAGEHEFTARAVDEAGTAVVSSPWRVFVDPHPTVAAIPFESEFQGGNWQERYGHAGSLIVNDHTNLPPFAAVSVADAGSVTWETDTEDPRALIREGTTNRIAAAWLSTEPWTISFSLRDGALHRLTLYFLDWDTPNERVQQVDFVDPTTGSVIVSHTLSNFSGGVYLTLLVRGNIDLRLSALAGPGSVLSGVFLDSAANSPPVIQLLQPTEGTVIDLPSGLALRARLSDVAGSIDRVEYYLDGRLVETVRQDPFDAMLPRLLEGSHAVFARAYDQFGDFADSTAINFRAALPRAKAVFLGEDTSTRGNWPERYGTEGFLLPPLTNWWPAELPVAVSGANTWLQSITLEPDHLLLPGQDVRTFSFFYSQAGIACDLNMADGIPRTLAAYFFDESLYAQTVTVLNPANGKVLDTRTVTNGAGGRYLVWNIQGRVSLVVTNPTPGVQTRLNGLFLGPFTNPAPTVAMTQPSADLEVVTPAKILLAAAAESSEGVSRVEFHNLKDRLGVVSQPPYEFLWEFPAAGSHHVFARAISSGGATADSEPLNVLVQFASASKVRFVGSDMLTLGNWQPRYGNEGYWLPGNFASSNLPPTVSLIHTQQWFDYGYADLPGALNLPGSILRTFSYWYGSDTWQFRLRSEDGWFRRVSLYNYAPGWPAPMSISVLTADTGSLLDTRQVAAQDAGTYLTWDIQGEVIIQLTAQNSRAFLNGLFIDPAPDPYLDWQRGKFSLSDQANPLVSGEAADPDVDGYVNWTEFLLGRNPSADHEPLPVWLSHDGNATFLHVLTAAGVEDGAVKVTSSTNLQTWAESAEVTPERVHDRGGQSEQVYRILPDAGSARFFRLQFQLPP